MAFDQRLQRFVFSQRNNAWRWNVSRVAVSDHMFTTTNAWFTFPWVLREKNCARTFSKQTTTNLLRKKYSSEKYEFVRRFCWKVEGPGRGWGAENKIIKGGKGFCRFHGDIVLLPKKKKTLLVVSSDIIDPLRTPWCFTEVYLDSVLRFVIDNV